MISINGDLALRQVGSENIGQIIALAKEIWIPSFRDYFSDEQLWSLFNGMYSEKLLRKNLNNANYHYYFIYNRQDRIIGYLALDFEGKSLKIDKIYIRPELQRSGIGSRILSHLLQEYKNKRIWLRVNRGNKNAVKLYKKHGFTTIASKDFHGPGQYKYEDYIMEKAAF